MSEKAFARRATRRETGGKPKMSDKTIVLKKDGHHYILRSASGDEREILLTILEYAENRRYNIGKNEVMALLRKLGYQVSVHKDFGVAS